MRRTTLGTWVSVLASASGSAPSAAASADRVHVAAFNAIPEPLFLADLRKRAATMLPRVDLPHVVLDTVSWARPSRKYSGRWRGVIWLNI